MNKAGFLKLKTQSEISRELRDKPRREYQQLKKEVEAIVRENERIVNSSLKRNA